MGVNRNLMLISYLHKLPTDCTKKKKMTSGLNATIPAEFYR